MQRRPELKTGEFAVTPDTASPAGGIRALTGDDAKIVSDLAIQSKSHWGYTRAQMAVFRDELAMTPADLETGLAFGWKQAHRILGFYTVALRAGDAAELEHLFVDPAYFRHGIGRKLLDHSIAQCKALGIDRMIVLSDPNAAVFYERCGAQLINQVPSSISGRTLPQYQIYGPNI